jgi:serine-type D-Ala-D-Ala carboxypeptidase/endopeptidase
MNWIARLLGLVVIAQGSSPAPLLTDAEIKRILVDRIDVQQQGVGIVVGVIDAGGRRVVAHGSFDATGNPRGVDGDTVFEIGSATKVFTSLLLADAVARGDVSLSDPVSKFLPASVKMPERGGKPITLADLATHTSGLPRLPSNLAPKDASNPYADYTPEHLYAFLSSYQLPRDVGAVYEYSNLGAGLLGHALARRAGAPYESLIKERIAGPLGMASTAIAVTDALRPRLAPGHDASRRRVSGWDLPTLAGAGALRSTVNDLLRFLAANLGYTPSPLAPAMASMLAVRRPTDNPSQQIALGWHVLRSPGGKEIAWHNGGTGGYRSFMAINRAERTGVVILSNTFTTGGVDDIALHILDRSIPLLAPAVRPKEVAVSAETLERYVGRYELAPTFVIAVTREGTRLFVQATNQPRFEAFASSDREFFLKSVDAQITFEVGRDGRATALILHQNGANQRARRIQ